MAAAADLPPALAQILDTCDAAITAAEGSLQPYATVPLKAAVSMLEPLDNARLNAVLAFTITSLTYGACGTDDAATCQ